MITITKKEQEFLIFIYKNNGYTTSKDQNIFLVNPCFYSKITHLRNKKLINVSMIQKEIDKFVSEGYLPVDPEDHYTLLIEYEVDGMGNGEDVEKRHRLEDRMNETLGWTGLGACDGGSIGSGTMEVCNFVVDFEVAKKVIESDLKGTEFENFTRIYDENA